MVVFVLHATSLKSADAAQVVVRVHGAGALAALQKAAVARF